MKQKVVGMRKKKTKLYEEMRQEAGGSEYEAGGMR
jgi:hypothetical protein